MGVVSQGRRYRRTSVPGKGDLVFLATVRSGMTDIIGLSSITLTTGTADDLANASWAFPSNAVTLQTDSDLGGDVMFDSSDSMAPIVRFGYEWYALFNVDLAWIGFHPTRGGIVFTQRLWPQRRIRSRNTSGTQTFFRTHSRLT